MKSAAKNIQLASYDDLFKTDEERQADAQERVQSLPLDKMEPFPNHPFKVIDDDKMLETVESIKERGVLVPILVRPKNDGNFEIVSGHRRHHASYLRVRPRFLPSCGRWTMILQSCSWWTATYSARSYCHPKKPLPTR